MYEQELIFTLSGDPDPGEIHDDYAPPDPE